MAPGCKFKAALDAECPLQIVGAINAISALMAKRAGFRALYLSGSGVASASYGLPDLGFTTLADVVEDARRILGVVDLPLLVDIDTGFGGTFFTIAHAVKILEKIGVAAVHIEDQVLQKRCGHRPGKQVVSAREMCDRIAAAVDARSHREFAIMARTDAVACEGLERGVERAGQYTVAGADAIFAEGLQSLSDFRTFARELSVPVLANLTEFGQTPLFGLDEMKAAGVAMVLYPLTAFRMMNAGAHRAYQTLRAQGTQRTLINEMQTREELYELLGYYRYEAQVDRRYGR